MAVSSVTIMAVERVTEEVRVMAVRRLKQDSIILLRIGQGAFDFKGATNYPGSDQLTYEGGVFSHSIEVIVEEVVL